jgi:type 1 fimbriae regulatory protein FimB
MWKNPPRAVAGVAGVFDTLTLDKMMSDRRHLVSAEVEKLIAATKGTRHETRDRCLLLLMFRHGLRVSEACGLRLSQADLDSRVLHVTRLKDGLSTTHPLRGDEIRAIKAWLADRARMTPETDACFLSERRRPLSRKTAWRMIRDYGRLAGLPVEAHPHMLRHTLSDIRRPIRHGLDGCGGSPTLLLPCRKPPVLAQFIRVCRGVSVLQRESPYPFQS